MKRTFVTVALVAAVVLIAASCASQPIAPTDPVSEFIREVRRTAPENALLGIGTSTHSNRTLARTTAEVRARAEIARQVDVMVRNMTNDYIVGSEAEPQAMLQFSETVTQALSQHAQQGAIIRDEIFFNGEQITIVMFTGDAFRNGLMNASQSAAALAPHMGAGLWALERMDQALTQQNALDPVLRNYD